VEDNVKAVQVSQKITKEIEEKIEKILENQPSAPMDWKKWKPYAPRR